MWALFLDVSDSFSGMIVKIDTLNIDRAADHIRDSSEHSFGRYSGAKMNRNMKTTAALWKCFLVLFFRDFSNICNMAVREFAHSNALSVT